MEEHKILTPEEYYTNAYNRIMSIAEAIIKQRPKFVFNHKAVYVFVFDARSEYKIVAEKDGAILFMRLGDGASLFLTKYSNIDYYEKD